MESLKIQKKKKEKNPTHEKKVQNKKKNRLSLYLRLT